ncbi:hypothetical protein [Streptomyces sp. NPDC051211]|uniref:hypothetical protein n=1 Tax=Streptomyces sp. NPDC051211 TaxID=3154643 RepID=UPI0034501F87
MISEPELDGEWEDGRPAEPVGPAQSPVPPVRGPSRPWRWALGGALAGSALCAGGLHLAGAWPTTGPEVAYRLPENLCKVLEVPALTRIGGNLHGNGPEHREVPHPVLDQAVCMLSSGERKARLGYFVTAQVALHKKADPATEFEVEPLLYEDSPERSLVPGLGERALMFVQDSGDGVELKVLDGGAVFRLSASATDFGDGGSDGERARMDPTAVQAALIEDMRALMEALRKE